MFRSWIRKSKKPIRNTTIGTSSREIHLRKHINFSRINDLLKSDSRFDELIRLLKNAINQTWLTLVAKQIYSRRKWKFEINKFSLGSKTRLLKLRITIFENLKSKILGRIYDFVVKINWNDVNLKNLNAKKFKN